MMLQNNFLKELNWFIFWLSFELIVSFWYLWSNDGVLDDHVVRHHDGLLQVRHQHDALDPALPRPPDVTGHHRGEVELQPEAGVGCEACHWSIVIIEASDWPINKYKGLLLAKADVYSPPALSQTWPGTPQCPPGPAARRSQRASDPCHSDNKK